MERSIQSSSAQTSPRASEEKLKEDPRTRLRNACNIQNTQERDAVLIEIAKDTDVDATKRYIAATKILDVDKKNKTLLELAKDTTIPLEECVFCILKDISQPEMRDEVAIPIAMNSTIDIQLRIDAAKTISDTILKNKIFIQLYNEALSLGVGEGWLTDIINRIQDPDLQALAREALEAGEPVVLTPAKSARKVQE